LRKRDPAEAATPAISAPPPAHRRRGRPPVTPGEMKRYPLSLYVTKALKDQLVQASQISGRPLTAEIEARLQRTLEEDRRKSELDLRIDKAMFEVRGAMLVLTGYRGIGAVDTDRHLQQVLAEHGEPGQPGRLLPVEISVTADGDGKVVLVTRRDGLVIRETPLDAGTAARLADELLVVAGSAQKEAPTSIEPTRRRGGRSR